MKNVPGIDVKFWKGTKECGPDDADRAYVWGPGVCLTFPATSAGKEALVKTLSVIGSAFDAGNKAGYRAAKGDLRKWLAD